MPLSGKLIADFESFYTAAQKTDGDLRRLESGADKVGTSFNRMTGSGASGLTTFHQGLSQADKTLAAFGVHIGPEIQAVKELGEASGKTASQIGLIGTASLAAAAALAGWKVGRMIADLTGLDDIIARNTAKLMGWGDVAAETAAAKADVLAKATANAGREITSLTEAININAEAAKTAAAPSWEKFVATTAAAHRQYRNLDDSQRASIRTMQEYGASTKEITETLKISEGAIRALTEADKLRAEQQKINTKLAKERTDAEAKAEKDYREFQNFVGVRQMEDEAARMKQQTELHAAETAAKKQAEEEWWQSVNQGLTIIGGVTDATTQAAAASIASTQQMADGWKLVGTEAKMAATNIQLAVPAGFSYEKAYKEAGLFVHDIGIAGSNVTSGKGIAGPSWGIPTMNVTFNNAFIDTPAGAQRTADRVGSAVVNQLKGQGTSLG